MNESFVRARTIFDRMMEESLARHSECNGRFSLLCLSLLMLELDSLRTTASALPTSAVYVPGRRVACSRTATTWLWSARRPASALCVEPKRI